MPEIKDIADTEFTERSEYFDLGKLDMVELRTDRQDMSEELLGVISAPEADMLSMSGRAYP